MNLGEFGNGGLQELFDHEFDKVLKNIQDPNTDPKATRKITMQITIKPDESRMVGQVDIKVNHAAAPIKGLATSILMEKSGAGIKVQELGGQVPGQVDMNNIVNMEGARK